MNYQQLIHVLIEVGERFGVPLVYVVGSSAVFATLREATDAALTATRDVDLALPPDAPISTDRIDFVIGEGSKFDQEFGYYAQGVGLETPRFAPSGWMQRTLEIQVRATKACFMEIHDLALAKYGAGREKDLEFTKALVGLNALERATLEGRVDLIDTSIEHRALILARIARDFAG